MKKQFATLEFPPVAVPVGAAELIEEVSPGKITGEEDRYSKTDLWDFNANVEGSQAVIDALTPALQEADPELLARIETGFAELDARWRRCAWATAGCCTAWRTTRTRRRAAPGSPSPRRPSTR